MSGNQGSQSLYDTLPDPQHCLRLLEIHPEPADDDIFECTLSTWRIDMAPSYHAISYTWGDPESISFVEVNGIYVRVRQNCLDALHQVGQNKYSRYYWIDTLCINQDNNFEKGFQVAMMGDIYRAAENVLICVDRHEGDSSELLFKTINKHKDLFVRASQSVPNLDELDWDVALDAQTRQALTKWKLSQRYSIAENLIRAFHWFEARPYFSRVWTLQERILARSITLCWGHSHCPGEAFRGLGIAMALRDRNTWMSRIISRLPSRLEDHLRPLLARQTLPWQEEAVYGGWRSRWRSDPRTAHPAYSLRPFHNMVPFRDEGFLSLWRVMANVSQLECYDPRDKLYGIIAVVDWSGLQKPKPDYACDVFDLALETLRLVALCPRDNEANETESDEPETDEPRTETGLPRLGRAIDVAEIVLKYFNLSTQSSAKFAASIEKRSRGIAAELERVDSTLVRYQDTVEWSGYELRLDTNDFEEPRARCSAAFDSSQGGGSGIRQGTVSEKLDYADGVLTDAHGRLRGLLPSSTRSGDWLVTANRRSLVIRGRPDDKYDLIGQAIGGWILTTVLRSESRELGSFRMAFHVEDLLALAENDERAAPSMVSVDTMSSTLSLVSHQELVYLSPGLSYAERSQGRKRMCRE